ncbi:MAG: photosynthetic complex assembly protein PuhC [Pseudomonadota bacterium]
MTASAIPETDFRIHKVPLIASGAIITLTLALAIFTSLGVFERQAVPEVVRAENGVLSSDVRSIRFNDGPDGSVWVSDAATGAELARFPQGEGGFVRATARAMVYNRQQHGMGPAVPFELIQWDNGSMTLRDTQTGRAVELASFGTKTHEIYQEILVKGRE